MQVFYLNCPTWKHATDYDARQDARNRPNTYSEINAPLSLPEKSNCQMSKGIDPPYRVVV